MSRWISLARLTMIWLIVIPFVHGVIPWTISTLTPRYGWKGASPGKWNWFGLIPVTVATTLLIWNLWWKRRSASGHRARSVLASTHAGERGTRPSSFLMVQGPYRFTRNPIYLAYLGLWLGWAVFFGSSGVLVGWLVLCVIANFFIVPQEERDLEAEFGEPYLQYKTRVPRWLGKARG